MNKEFVPLNQLSGMAAIFVRGFMEHFDPTNSAPLRPCQEAGKTAVEDHELEISISYCSTLTRKLRDARVIIQKKKGRNFFLDAGPNYKEFMEFLENDNDYGLSVGGDFDEALVRSSVAEFLDEHGAVLSKVEKQIPKPGYEMLMKRFRAGEVHIAFIKADLPSGVKYKGTTQRIETFHE